MTSCELPWPWACPRCGGTEYQSGRCSLKPRLPWFIQQQSSGAPQEFSASCSECSLPLSLEGGTFRYPFDELLTHEYTLRQLSTWQAMQVNGSFSYSRLAQASCSSDENLGAATFTTYLSEFGSDWGTSGVALDIGCGPSTGTYMRVLPQSLLRVGVEPLGETDFDGLRVRGIGEFFVGIG